MTDEAVARRLHQLYSELRRAIQNGELRPGERLEGERTLAEAYGISRMAVKRAMQRLEAEGLIYRVQGRGTFVQSSQAERLRMDLRPAAGFSGITEVTRRQGRRADVRLLGAGRLPPCAYLSQRLHLAVGEGIYAVSRLRLSDGEAVALETSYLPCKYAVGVESVDFARVPLYDYLDAIGRGVRGGSTRLRIVQAGRREAEALGIPRGQAVYMLENTGRTSGGLVVEYTESFLRPDRMELFSTRSV